MPMFYVICKHLLFFQMSYLTSNKVIFPVYDNSNKLMKWKERPKYQMEWLTHKYGLYDNIRIKANTLRKDNEANRRLTL